MSKVFCLCGRICCGKSTYARRLRDENSAVILSVDEITLALFGQHAGSKHDMYVERAERYLYDKSLELISTGINVVLDWGFWQRNERDYARKFYADHGIDMEFYYINIEDELWRSRIEKRNADVLAGKTSAYYIDENLAKKFASLFQPPEADESNIRIIS